jgi:hypothetical protein
LHLQVRRGAYAGLGAGLQRAARAVDPTLPLYNVRTMPEHIERNLFLRRIPARMFMVLGPLLLCLAALGIYAVVSYAVRSGRRLPAPGAWRPSAAASSAAWWRIR